MVMAIAVSILDSSLKMPVLRRFPINANPEMLEVTSIEDLLESLPQLQNLDWAASLATAVWLPTKSFTVCNKDIEGSKSVAENSAHALIRPVD